MLKELKVRNFLSYDDTTVEFDSSGTIAVVGENGHGKSSLLEAIPFCLFGDGRGDLQSLIRIGSSGEMKVRVVMADIPTQGREVIIERGIRGAGTGYTKVWLDGKLMASGGAKPSPNKAQDFINALLGIDQEAFMLTSFFGLGTNDSLMQVRPAERLETLQKLAGVDVCGKFHDLAVEKSKTYVQQAESEKAALAVLSASEKSPLELMKEQSAAVERQKRLKTDIDGLLSKRTSLLKDEDRYRGLSTERESIRSKRDTLLRQKDREEKRLSQDRDELKSSVELSQELSDKRKSLEKELSSMRTVKKIREEYDALQTEKGDVESAITLRNTALASGHSDSSDCPLCGNSVDADVHKRWSAEVRDLVERQSKIKEQLAVCRKEGERRNHADAELDRVKSRLESVAEEGSGAETRIKESEKELSKINADVEKIETRLLSLKKEMSGFEEVINQMREIDKDMASAQTELGSVDQLIIGLKKEIEGAEENVRKQKASRKKISEFDSSARAYKIVADAFSRYAIPVQLLSNLRAAIEKRSTLIYRHFNSGVIQIRDTGGAKPGVEFVLVDEMGERAYKALSSGEKVMVFLAVRVALTQIINASRNNKIDFLILDEVAGNLSPVKRDSLTRLINTLLRKFFPQVFMVSHVELRDIFNKTLKVEKVEGVSHVQ